MYGELAIVFVYIEGVAEVFHTLDVWNNRLFLVHFEKQFPLDDFGY
jgi:hypothetical protein